MASKLWIQQMVVGPIQTNCYIIGNDGTKEAVLVDPGDEAERIIAFLKEKDVRPIAILLTHGHFDHVMAVRQLCEAYPSVEVVIGAEERAMVEDASLNSGFGPAEYHYAVSRYVEGGDVLNYFGLEFYVIESAGHTQGSVCYYLSTLQLLFAGDTIFFESYGRCDLPTGNAKKMQESLQHLLTVLPEQVKILTGHGPSTTVEHEKRLHGFDRM